MAYYLANDSTFACTPEIDHGALRVKDLGQDLSDFLQEMQEGPFAAQTLPVCD